MCAGADVFLYADENRMYGGLKAFPGEWVICVCIVSGQRGLRVLFSGVDS